MMALQNYKELFKNPWTIILFGIAGTFGYYLDSVFVDQTEYLRILNYICSCLTAFTLVYYLVARKHEYVVLKLYAIYFWGNLLVAPFIMVEYDPFEWFFMRNSLFYFSLLPIVALMFGTKEYIFSTILFFLQFVSITFITNNSFLLESITSILIVLAIYALIIYAFVTSINHYFNINLKVQQKLIDQSTALMHSDNTKGKLLSIIGHDLRSPLMSLTSLSVLIEDETKNTKNSELNELIGILNTTIDQTAFLVNNLLEWSRSQDNRINIDLKPIRIEPFLNGLRDLHSFSLSQKNLNFKIGPIKAVEIFADQNTLQTILRNIVTNSIKFTPNGGTITVSTKNGKKGTFIVVKDTGIGMEKELVDKLLDVDMYTSRKGTLQETGSGIGFNLSAELMQLHNGTIGVESKPDKGTTITLFFPSIELQAEVYNT
jgi:signal transduction histidine kinase